MAKRKQIPTDTPAFIVAVIGGMICGVLLSSMWVAAGLFWFIWCVFLPILPCSLARLKIIPVGIVANGSMSLALQSLLLYDTLKWPLRIWRTQGYEYDWFKLLFPHIWGSLLMLIIGSAFSLVVSLPMRKLRVNQPD